MADKIKNREERIGRVSASSLRAAEINTVVRRLGVVLLRALETMESNLGDSQLREDLRDALKPVADYMVHFDIKEHSNGEP